MVRCPLRTGLAGALLLLRLGSSTVADPADARSHAPTEQPPCDSASTDVTTCALSDEATKRELVTPHTPHTAHTPHTVHDVSRSSGSSGSSVPVEWHVVGCQFSGFLCELLGLVQELSHRFSDLRIFVGGAPNRDGKCGNGLAEGMFQEEGRAFVHLNNPEKSQIDTAEGVAIRTCLDAGTGAPMTRTIDYGVSYGDLPRAVGGYSAPSAVSCRCHCEASQACVAWTYHANSKLCYLKGDVVEENAVEESDQIWSGRMENRTAVHRVVVWHGACQ
jgi:hypothetical protein